jgi:hypothetical protein
MNTKIKIRCFNNKKAAWEKHTMHLLYELSDRESTKGSQKATHCGEKIVLEAKMSLAIL